MDDEQQELYLRARTMSSIEPDPVRWVWQGRLAEGMLSILEGDPGVGKSSLVLDIAARITRGWKLPGDDRQMPPADVVIFAGEDEPSQTIRPRLDNAGADTNRVFYLDTSAGDNGPSYPLSLPRDLDALDNILSSLRPKLVLIEPIMMFFGGDTDTNSDSHVRVVLSKLKAIAEKHSTAILLGRHLTKAKDTDPMYRGQGSIGIIAAVRFSFIATFDPYDTEMKKRVLIPVKQNASEPAPSLTYSVETVEGSDAARIEWHGVSDLTKDDLGNSHLSEADRNALMDAIEWVRHALRNGPVRPAEVKQQCGKDGFEFSEIKRALAAEKVGRKYNSFQNQWEYQYPHGTSPGSVVHDPDTWKD